MQVGKNKGGAKYRIGAHVMFLTMERKCNVPSWKSGTVIKVTEAKQGKFVYDILGADGLPANDWREANIRNPADDVDLVMQPTPSQANAIKAGKKPRRRHLNMIFNGLDTDSTSTTDDEHWRADKNGKRRRKKGRKSSRSTRSSKRMAAVKENDVFSVKPAKAEMESESVKNLPQWKPRESKKEKVDVDYKTLITERNVIVQIENFPGKPVADAKRIKLKIAPRHGRTIAKRSRATQFRKEHTPACIAMTKSRRWHHAASQSASAETSTAAWSNSESAYGSQVSEDAYGSQVSESAYGSQVSEEAYGSQVSEEAYGSQVSEEAYGSGSGSYEREYSFESGDAYEEGSAFVQEDSEIASDDPRLAELLA